MGKSFRCGFSRKEQAEQGKDMLLRIISGGSGAEGLSLVVWYLALE